MVDIQTNGNGLTYLLADYAKSVNGGKALKINAKKWENIMKVVTEINNKRTDDNKLFTGGTNLFGKTNENFVLSSKEIHFSDSEMALILKEMGIENTPKKEENLGTENFQIKGLSVERVNPPTAKDFITNKVSIAPEFTESMHIVQAEEHPETSNISPKQASETTQKNTDFKPHTYNFEATPKFSPELMDFLNDVKNNNIKNLAPVYASYTTTFESRTSVTSAKDTTDLAPPFEIRTPLPGKRGGGSKTITEQFHRKSMEIADTLGCKYEDLITVMNFESGIDTTSGKENPRKKPVGLIQFTGTAIRALNKTYGYNLTKNKILQMDEMEQLELVKKYFEMAKRDSSRLRNKKQLDAADLYSLTILPNRAGRDILCQKGEKNANGKLLSYYESNAGIDIGGDGIITRADVLAKLDEFRVHVQVV